MPYYVEKKVPYKVEVPVDKPYNVEVPKPYPVIVEKKVPVEVVKKVPVEVKVPEYIPIHEEQEEGSYEHENSNEHEESSAAEEGQSDGGEHSGGQDWNAGSQEFLSYGYQWESEDSNSGGQENQEHQFNEARRSFSGLDWKAGVHEEQPSQQQSYHQQFSRF